MMRGGLGSLIVVGAILYFTGAGAWVWERVQVSGDYCHANLTPLDTTLANTVCGVVASAVESLNGVDEMIATSMSGLKDSITGAAGLDNINRYTDDLRQRLSSMASSQDQLTQMMRSGPGSQFGGSSGQQLQQAIDSFTIGQKYLNGAGTTEQGMQWLAQGAAQPSGYGLFSQLQLGSMYANGGHGAPQNPQAAQMYLEQANQSISILTGDRSPQSQQMLKALPSSPEQMKRQINQAIRQLKSEIK